MQKPGFGATTLLIIVLTLVGLSARELRPLIPPSSPNSLVRESAPYLKQGAYEPIDWRPMGPAALARASGGRPILLAIGTPWSRMGRLADAGVFADPYIQALLRRAFVCVRVDASFQPEWLSAYLPFSRAQMGVVPDFQIWFLDPNGNPYEYILVQSPKEILDYDTFKERLIRARDTLGRILNDDPNAPVPGEGQRADLAQLSGSPAKKNSPGMDFADAVLQSTRQSVYGGFPNIVGTGDPPYQRLLPQALQYLLMTGRHNHYRDFQTACEYALRSPLVDWLEGGFYIRSTSLDWMEPEYDKTAVQNAELMQVFALAGAVCEEPRYTAIAKATFDCLAGPFMSDGFVQACRVGDERRGGRSSHAGFPPKLLRDALGGTEVETADGRRVDAYRWARDNLGLRVEDNPRMLVRMPDPQLPQREPQALATVLTALRLSAQQRPEVYAGPSLAEVNGIVAARMTWVARLWNDTPRAKIARKLYLQLDSFVAEGDVDHFPHAQNESGPYLGDYLAYADAALQDYLANGTESSFKSGLAILSRARELFGDDRVGGAWNVSHFDPNSLPLDKLPGQDLIGGPQIVDDESESCTARVIRLTNAYRRLLRDRFGRSPASAAALWQSLEAEGFGAAAMLSSMTQTMAPVVSGYYCAVLPVIDEAYAAHAFVVGPDCLHVADQLFRRSPMHMVAGCIGSVRPDLQALPPGVYVMGRDEIHGKPLTLEQAVAKLNGLPSGPSAARPDLPHGGRRLDVQSQLHDLRGM